MASSLHVAQLGIGSVRPALRQAAVASGGRDDRAGVGRAKNRRRNGPGWPARGGRRYGRPFTGVERRSLPISATQAAQWFRVLARGFPGLWALPVTSM